MCSEILACLTRGGGLIAYIPDGELEAPDQYVEGLVRERVRFIYMHDCVYISVHDSPTTSREKTSMAAPAIMSEGTKKLSPQGGLGSLVVGLAQKDGIMVPRMLPREVCAFQIPIINPRLHVEHITYMYTCTYTYTHRKTPLGTKCLEKVKCD